MGYWDGPVWNRVDLLRHVLLFGTMTMILALFLILFGAIAILIEEVIVLKIEQRQTNADLKEAKELLASLPKEEKPKKVDHTALVSDLKARGFPLSPPPASGVYREVELFEAMYNSLGHVVETADIADSKSAGPKKPM